MIDKNKLQDKTERQLVTRQAALAATLDEIDYLEKNKDKFKTPDELVSWGYAIGAAKVRRDRQHNACKASQALLDTLRKTK